MKLLLIDRPEDINIIKNNEVEFFGPWAQPINHPEDLKKPTFEPYPTPEDVYSAGVRSVKSAREALDLVYEVMPEITGVKGKSKRFWQLLFGHHVVVTCGIIEDIRMRDSALPDEDYLLGTSAGNFFQHPRTWMESIELLSSDAFRCWAASLILKKRFEASVDIKYNFSLKARIDGTATWKGRLIQKLKKVQRNPLLLYNRLLKTYKKYSFQQQRKENIRSLIWDNNHLFLSFNKNCFIFRDNLIKKQKRNGASIAREASPGVRDKIKGLFPSPLGEVLEKSLPISALEGLRDTIDTVDISGLETYKNLTRIYSHGQIIVEYDFWRASAALLGDHGLEVISAQHGGGINYYSHPSIFLEGELLDGFISWGFDSWPSQGDERYTTSKPRPLPSLYISKMQKEVHGKYKKNEKRKWKSLIVVFSEDKNIKWLYSPLFPDLAYDYFNRQKALLNFFETQQRSLVKLYPVEYGWKHKDWILQRFPGLQCEFGAKNFVDYISDSEMVVVDYNSTAFLEVLALGLPFLCTWNRRWFKGHDLFERCLDKLKAAGIFYDRPEELIDAYERSISKDVRGWWYQEERFNVVKDVSKEIVLNSEDAEQYWCKELSK